MKHITEAAVILIAISMLLSFGGCDLAAPQKKGQQKPAPPAAAPAKPAEPEKPAEQEQEAVLIEAAVGAGAKGHYGSGGGEKPSDIITVPVEALFRTQERLAYGMVEKYFREYKELNGGKGPETHEEYMEKVVKPTGVHLPVLPAGQEYLYDPEQEKLMIRKPK